MRKELKSTNSEGYKEYKKAKRQANTHRTYNGSETLVSAAKSSKGQAKVDQMLAEYSNKYLDDLVKKKKV